MVLKPCVLLLATPGPPSRLLSHRRTSGTPLWPVPRLVVAGVPIAAMKRVLRAVPTIVAT